VGKKLAALRRAKPTKKRASRAVPTAIALGIALISGITCALAAVWMMRSRPKQTDALQDKSPESEILISAEKAGVIERINEVLAPYHGHASIHGSTLFLEGELPSREAVDSVLNLVKVGLKADVLDVLTPSSAGPPDLVDLHAFGRPDGTADRPIGIRSAVVFNGIRVAENGRAP
jgi:hypothetical protein